MISSKLLSPGYTATGISAAGLSANRERLNVAAANLANAESPGYKRHDVVMTAVEIPSVDGSFSAALDRNSLTAPSVAAVLEDQSPARMEYQPNHPLANAQGYVEMPNVSGQRDSSARVESDLGRGSKNFNYSSVSEIAPCRYSRSLLIYLKSPQLRR